MALDLQWGHSSSCPANGNSGFDAQVVCNAAGFGYLGMSEGLVTVAATDSPTSRWHRLSPEEPVDSASPIKGNRVYALGSGKLERAASIVLQQIAPAGVRDSMDEAQKARFCAILKAEFAKHRWDTFVDEPPSVAKGGSGVVVPGCSTCKVRLQTVSQFVDHLCERVVAAIEREN